MEIPRLPNHTLIDLPARVPGEGERRFAFFKGKVDSHALYQSRMAAAKSTTAAGGTPDSDFQRTLIALKQQGQSIAIERVAPMGEELTGLDGYLRTPDDQLVRLLESGIGPMRTQWIQGSPIPTIHAATKKTGTTRLLSQFVVSGSAQVPFFLWLPDDSDLAGWDKDKKVIVDNSVYGFLPQLEKAYPEVKFFKASDMEAFRGHLDTFTR